jgi:hypothetical protein
VKPAGRAADGLTNGQVGEDAKSASGRLPRLPCPRTSPLPDHLKRGLPGPTVGQARGLVSDIPRPTCRTKVHEAAVGPARQSTPEQTEALWRIPGHCSTPAPGLLRIVPWSRRISGEAAEKRAHSEAVPAYRHRGTTASTGCAWAAALLPAPRVEGDAPTSIESGDCHTAQEAASPGRWSRRLRCGRRALGIVGLPFGVARQDISGIGSDGYIQRSVEQTGVPVLGGTCQAGFRHQTVDADADNASAVLQGSLGMRLFRYVPYLNDQPKRHRKTG